MNPPGMLTWKAVNPTLLILAYLQNGSTTLLLLLLLLLLSLLLMGLLMMMMYTICCICFFATTANNECSASSCSFVCATATIICGVLVCTCTSSIVNLRLRYR